MEFYKRITIAESEISVNHHTKMLFLGSCFANNIGAKLKDYKFDVTVNPFGILFNPLSITHFLNATDFSIFKREDRYYSWLLGTKIHASSEDELKLTLHEIQQNTIQLLKTAEVVLVTFGSAWVYELKESNEIVGNCHKMPQQLFSKKLLESQEIIAAYKELMNKYSNVKQWIFTVSPVRHWKDGVRENNVSKGVLHHAIHILLSQDKASYFPAYEILLDELRDYRFYKSDYLHPSEHAIDYIYERFGKCYFSNETLALNLDIRKINAYNAHYRNLDSKVENYKIKNLEQKIDAYLLGRE